MLERKDKGRVALMLSDNAWLWARGHEGGGPHAEMMRQIAQWLMKDAALEEESLKLSVAGDKLVVELQTMAEKPAPVKVKTPSGELRTVMPEAVSPGIWRTEIPAAEFGIYTAERDGDKPVRTAINVGPASPREFAGTISTLEPLKPAVDATGGSTRRMVDAAGVTAVPRVEQRRAGQSMKGDDWIGLRMTEASTLKDVSRTPLIPPWLGFAFIVGLLGAAWWREGEKKLWSRTEKTAANGTKPDNGPAPAP